MNKFQKNLETAKIAHYEVTHNPNATAEEILHAEEDLREAEMDIQFNS